ncbi:MAG: response regulator transcription factor [Acidobacteria bacterium]|nr:response regulator transcription factor [Acidobacteriota bacterium]
MDTGLRVLVVDDSDLIRRRVVEVLAGVPGVAQVSEAPGAPEARLALRDASPDVIVLDIWMPGGNGIDLLRSIKTEGRRAFVVMLTNYTHGPYRQACLDAGADAFLDKSADLGRLFAIVERLAEER